ncbi:MAG TPA: hypothetical protein VJL90_01195 [Pseudorhodoplanes sp.]|nr:hypothetical protein [Pseudorhodoplanes sp.]
MSCLSYRFEELPDFRDGEFRSGAHSGCAEISYSQSGEWTVRAIALDCHNGKCGEAARGKSIPLSRAYQGALWEALCESLDAFARDHIQDAVNRALEAEGVSIADVNFEHRLHAHELA